MNAPASVRILHLEFELRFVEPDVADHAKSLAWCNKTDLIIYFSKSLKPRLLADCALHEVLHAIHFTLGCEDEMKEEQIAQLAGPLCCVIRDNPEFFEWVKFLLSNTGHQEVAVVTWDAANEDLRKKLLDLACQVFREGDTQRAMAIRDLANPLHSLWE